MGRNIRVEGITLHSRRFMEFHKDVTILSREGGVFNAVLHGGYKGKSRMAGGTEPFRRVAFLLYHDPVKDTYKISDGEIINSFENLRLVLPKIYLASLWSELMIRTRGAGAGFEEGERVYFLLLKALEVLETIETRKLPYLNIQFLWRFLALSGLSMDFSSCSSCGRGLDEGETLIYSSREIGFLCENCKRRSVFNERQSLSPGAAKYLSRTQGLDILSSIKIIPPQGDLTTLESIPLEMMISEMDIHFKTQDYHQFMDV
ncbi:MAG: DNA repair protein RecO [Spirochaetales bacterium]|nr:DNA repair protein RecO [Spirochaetales bacterium]